MVQVVKAYILVNSVPGMVWDIAEAATKIEGVKMANAVTGQFDVIIYLEFVKMDELSRIVEKLHSVDGVLRTQTAIAIPPRLK